MSALDRYFFRPVAAARPYLLVKGFLFLLAFDCFIDLVSHGGRYGVGGFNVAHFAVVDALLPAATPALYVGLLLLAGLVALVLAVGGLERSGLAFLAVVYTWSWTMSQLDSYQHHYLLTIALGLFAMYPIFSARDAFEGAPTAATDEAHDEDEEADDETKPEPATKRGRKQARALARKKDKAEKRVRVREAAAERQSPGKSPWAYHVTCVSLAIVYAYTAVSKTETQWREGFALQQIAPEALEPFRVLFTERIGLEDASFWWLMGHSVVLVQVVIAAGYLAAPLADGVGKYARVARIVSFVGFLGAASFHLGAEYMKLQIGWFSYYMLVAACAVLLPARAVHFVGYWLSYPVRAVGALLSGERAGLREVRPLAIGAAITLVLVGWWTDLPGAIAASTLAGGLLIGLVGYRYRMGDLGRARPLCLGGAIAALAMWLSFATTDARYDYYRWVGGDMRRRGDLEESLAAYEKANRYAPEDANRRRQEDEVRRELGLTPRWDE